MTLLDVIVLAIVLLAAIGGFRVLGGSGRAGRLLGLLVGAWFGLALGARLATSAQGPTASWGLLAVCAIGGMLLGAALGGWIGGLLSRVLITSRLGIIDRLIGAVAGAAGALLILWVLALVLPGLVEPLGGRSEVLAAVDGALPNAAAALRTLLAGP